MSAAGKIDARIVGFDKASESLVVDLPVPAAALERVKRIAEVPAADPDLMGAYPLTAEKVKLAAEAAHVIIDPGRYDYFLEVYED